MKKQIQKPENWQDFEELCKVLWGEIWNCPEIKKNGRSGQNQHGVDIYGIPQHENKYYGIQCKGKDEYTKAILTEKEIITEINKAKSFKPALKKLYFTTTANKVEKIEEFIRIKNIEHIESNLFEVHVFSWEDIAYLIDQNKRAYDWYIRKIDFALNFNVSVMFEDMSTMKTFRPILIKNHIRYKYQPEHDYNITNARYYKSPQQIRDEKIEIHTDPQPIHFYINSTAYNKSSCVNSVRIKNVGNIQLENFKLYITFKDDCYISNIVSKKVRFLDNNKYKHNIRWVKGTDDLEFREENEILVQNDEVWTDKFCIRPTIEYPFCIILPWKLVAKDFTEYGKFRICLDTAIKEKTTEESYSAVFENEVILENFTSRNEE